MLGINSSLFIMLGIFVGAYWVLYAVFIKKLCVLIVERFERTQGRAENVELMKQELQQKKAEWEIELKKIRASAIQRYDQIKAKALDEQKNILNHAREEAMKKIQESRHQAQAFLKQEQEKLKAQVPSLVTAVVERILTPKATHENASGELLRV